MKKLFANACVALAACAGQGYANDGAISSDALSAMGLGGAAIVSDEVASEVRGMGYTPHSTKPWSLAAGGSIAFVGSEHAGAGSLNVYAAEGRYMAAGENFSEAGKTYTHTETITVGPLTKTLTTTKSIHVYAGGFSSASSF